MELRISVKFTQESTAESETISRALSAAVGAVVVNSSINVESQITSTYIEVAKQDTSTTSLAFESQILGPCGEVGFSR